MSRVKIKSGTRLYSFVAGGYLNSLQKGLQSGHVIGDISVKYNPGSVEDKMYRQWAAFDKVIIIKEAFNQAGVLEAAETFREYATQNNMPFATFREDEASMNGMATAFSIVVPARLWDVEKVESPVTGKYYQHCDKNGIPLFVYQPGTAAYDFISKLLRYPLTTI